MLVAGAAWSTSGHACRVEDSASPDEFVSRFYADYIRTAAADPLGAPWHKVVEDGSGLGAELALAMRADVRAQQAAVGQVVGIDFDPFLYSQDPAQKYSLGKTKCEKGKCRLQLKTVGDNGELGSTDLILWVANKQGCWRVVNVQYPGGTQLVDILVSLQRDRNR